jgi:hypothetical protein
MSNSFVQGVESVSSTNAPQVAPSARLTPKESFDVAREHIRHEDGLVNTRITWLQVFQGFLFTAFFAGLNLFRPPAVLDDGARFALSAGVLVLPLLGILASLTAYLATRSALSQIHRVEDWWSKNEYKGLFPPIAGEHGATFHGRRILGAHMLLVFAFAWAVFLGLFLYVVLK